MISIEPLKPLPSLGSTKNTKENYRELAKILSGAKAPAQPKMFDLKVQKARMPRSGSTRGGNYSTPAHAFNSLADIWVEKHEEDQREKELQRIGTSRASTSSWLSNPDVDPALMDEIYGVAAHADPDGIDFYQDQVNQAKDRNAQTAYNEQVQNALGGIPTDRSQVGQYVQDNAGAFLGDKGDTLFDILDYQFEDKDTYEHNCPNTCLLYTSPSPRDS